jgi:hypothetical protein
MRTDIPDTLDTYRDQLRDAIERDLARSTRTGPGQAPGVSAELGSVSEAEDVVQDAFLRLTRHAPRKYSHRRHIWRP